MSEGRAKQWVSSDGEVVRAVFKPAKNWAVLPNQRPGEWIDGEAVLVQPIPDRLGYPVFVELVWSEGGWRRTEREVMTGFDLPRHAAETHDAVFAVAVDDEGNIRREGRFK